MEGHIREKLIQDIEKYCFYEFDGIPEVPEPWLAAHTDRGGLQVAVLHELHQKVLTCGGWPKANGWGLLTLASASPTSFDEGVLAQALPTLMKPYMIGVFRQWEDSRVFCVDSWQQRRNGESAEQRELREEEECRTDREKVAHLSVRDVKINLRAAGNLLVGREGLPLLISPELKCRPVGRNGTASYPFCFFVRVVSPAQPSGRLVHMPYGSFTCNIAS